MEKWQCESGQFIMDNGGAYKITDPSVRGNWEYIYQNGDILLRVDQRGLVNCQSLPPKDIMLFKRESSDRFSKLITWVRPVDSKCAVSNFGFPKSQLDANGSICFYPEKAEYTYNYGEFSVRAEVFVPLKTTTLIVTTTVTNNQNKAREFVITPTMYPYINQAVIAPWDKSEWYLSTYARRQAYGVEFITKLNNPGGDETKRRLVTFMADSGSSVDVELERFEGAGAFDMPSGIIGDTLAYKTSELGEQAVEGDKTMYGYAPIYATMERVSIGGGESKTFTQVLSMQDIGGFGIYSDSENAAAEVYLTVKAREAELVRLKEYHDGLCKKCYIKTGDITFDNYVNTFLPLQMNWVAALDRGWPTGMRGVRDASNDFMGMMLLDSDWARRIIEQLFACERTDGWFPRQISVESRKGKHDLRAYVDGGVFALELLTQYYNVTADKRVMDTIIPWLDSDEDATIREHYLRALQFYTHDKNIGEHGLVKIYEGDWLDAVNSAGKLGRGESVTVTAQVVMALNGAVDIIGVLAQPDQAKQLSKKFIEQADGFKSSLNKYAYNKKGFYNSVFNDDGKWIFSDNDPDNACRIYAPSNYYAIVCGAATVDMQDSVFANTEKLLSEAGYKLFTPPLGKPPIATVGRIASGDMPNGLWENGTVYNHGSQGFRARALAHCGKGDELKQILEFMLPYSQKTHPISQTHSAPYAVVNCYQGLPLANNRGGMPFLTGTIAMAMRAVYNWYFGIMPTFDGLILQPCLPSGKIDSNVHFVLRGKNLDILYSGDNSGGKINVTLNGKIIKTKKALCGENAKLFIEESELNADNIIEVSLS